MTNGDATGRSAGIGMSVLVADDEAPAVEELARLLGDDPRVGTVYKASSGAEAVRHLAESNVDAVFLDIHMPGLSGFDLARAIGRFDRRPAIVFVTADEDGALEAFDLAAIDYLLKPVRLERLTRCIGRVVEVLDAAGPGSVPTREEMIAVTTGATTRMIRRDDVHYVQAQGDYARLYTDDASYLVRVPISDLEQQWADAGFLRIHRSYLVDLSRLEQLKLSAGHSTVTVAGAELPVSRRLVASVREIVETNRIRPRP